jgi:hypothetical protein
MNIFVPPALIPRFRRLTYCNAPHCKRIYELKYPTVSESN